MRILKWTWRSWPVHGVFTLLFVHWFLVPWAPSQQQVINETMALLLQVVGGLLVLYSIDSNIGVIRGGSLLAELRHYLGDFPLIKKSHVLEVQGTSHSVFSSKARLSVGRKPQSVEERLSYLQKQIDEARRDLQENIDEIAEKLRQQQEATDGKVSKLQQSMNRIDSKLENVSVGGVKIQIFGVLLLIYGSLTAYVA